MSPAKLGSGSSSSSASALAAGITSGGGTRFSKTGKRIGRPPKKGTLLANSSLGGMAVSAATSSVPGSNPDQAVSIKRQVSPPSSPEPDDFDAKRRKTSPNKR